jgi:hypothetical protein
MKNYFPFVFFALVFFSCSGKNKIPNTVLPQNKMVAVLWDMFRADQFLMSYVLPADSTLHKNDEVVRYYEEIFKLHQINKAAFQTSFTFYEAHPLLMKQLLDSLNAKGTASNQDLNQPSISDSSLIRKIHPAIQ